MAPPIKKIPINMIVNVFVADDFINTYSTTNFIFMSNIIWKIVHQFYIKFSRYFSVS